MLGQIRKESQFFTSPVKGKCNPNQGFGILLTHQYTLKKTQYSPQIKKKNVNSKKD